ncbi:MAG: sulfatase [Porticoccaceae bacterium]|jgi:arylsulfatase A-like enzyme|nr:sulfatase [Porticoccaceae bacterium]MDB2382750.1 sulfatase [Porticoccaceae bacterium]MDB2565813.1 sulfatase [Porticoccaceae bacterium]MDB2621050.1 sulfatase [Porticoccaceae bacterium]
MKKILAIMIALIVLTASIGWSFRVEILLGVIEYRFSSIEVSEPRDIPWKQGPSASTTASLERPPNIILIVADDLGYNDISTFGGGIVQTPSIDRLAKEGAVFNQSYSGASTCAPSRAMMMTGRYPTRTGFEFTPTPAGMGKAVSFISGGMDNNLPPGFYDEEMEANQPPYQLKGLPPEEITIAETLKDSGYYTAHIGKWHLGNDNGMAPHEQGFDDSLLMTSGLYLPEDDLNVVNAKIPFDPIDKFLWKAMTYSNSFNSGDGNRFKPKGYLTDYWTDESINVIKANKNRPFFLYLAHWGPHTPLQATREDYEAVGDIRPHRKRVYAAMVRAIDRSVGRVLDTLDQEGLADNTLVMFTSDNGGAGYIGIPEVNQPFRGWKITMFEGGLRVPMMIKWPSKITAGTVVDTPVAHIDVMPTLAAAAATQSKAAEIDGLNLLPLATSQGDQNWDRETLFWQNGHYQVVRHGDWKLQVNDRPTDGLQHWLFDLAKDPTEQNNLAAVRQDKVNELKGLLVDHQANAVGALYPATTQMPVMVDKTLAETFEEGDEYVYTPN